MLDNELSLKVPFVWDPTELNFQIVKALRSFLFLGSNCQHRLLLIGLKMVGSSQDGSQTWWRHSHDKGFRSMKDLGVKGSWILLWFQRATEFRLLVVGVGSLHEGSERSLHPSVRVKPPGLQWRPQDARSARGREACTREDYIQKVDPGLERDIYFRHKALRQSHQSPWY